MIDTESDLIQRAQRGDREAFSLLARQFERRIYSLALYYVRNPSDAEDLSQEVWLKAYRGLASFRGDSSFYTWLRHITINAFLNHRRALTMRTNGEPQMIRMVEVDAADYEESIGPALSSYDPEHDLHQKIMVERVMNALTELTPQQRLIFILKHNEGMTYEEIATSLNCSAGTIKKSLFRTVQKLRQHLGFNQGARGYLRFAAGGK